MSPNIPKLIDDIRKAFDFVDFPEYRALRACVFVLSQKGSPTNKAVGLDLRHQKKYYIPYSKPAITVNIRNSVILASKLNLTP